MARLLLALHLLLAIGTQPRSVAAADKAKCLSAHEAAQSERTAGKLLVARVSLGICADDGCPGPVRADCATWLEEVEKAIPTLVVSVRDEDGKDLPSAKLTLDGNDLSLDGKSVRVDPGKHVVVAHRPSGDTRTVTVVVAQGEKDRPVLLTFATDAGPRRRSVVPWLLGGVGVLGLAGFTVLGLTTNARVRELEDGCAPRCDPADKDAVARRYLVGDILLGVSVVALGAAVTIYVLDRPAKAAIAPTHGGAFATVGLAF